MYKPLSLFTTTGEVQIDTKAYYENWAIYKNNPIAGACRDKLTSDAIKEPTVYENGKPKDKVSPHYKEIVQKVWLKWCLDLYDEVNIAGIAPVKFVETNGIRYPVVISGTIGRDYIITVKRNRQGVKEFTYYKTVSLRTGEPIEPKVDRKVIVLHGFGYDPDFNGYLCSPISRIVTEHYSNFRMNAFYQKAAYGLSDPMVLIERPLNAGVDQGMVLGVYGNKDNEIEKSAKTFVKNKDEIREAFSLISEMEEEFYYRSETNPNNDGSEYNISKKPFLHNMLPLPPGHKVTHQKQPAMPGDYVTYSKTNEYRICANMGVPRFLIMHDEGKTDNSSKIALDSYRDTVNKWRDVFSTHLTWIHKVIYGDEDGIKSISAINKEELANLTEEQIFDIATTPRVTLRIPPFLNETPEGARDKFFMGVIDYANYASIVKTIAGYPEDTNEKNLKDPFSIEAKMNILRQTQGAILKQLGLVGDYLLPRVDQPEKKDGESKEKKKKKEEGEDNKKEKEKPSSEEGKKEKKDGEKKRKKEQEEKSETTKKSKKDDGK